MDHGHFASKNLFCKIEPTTDEQLHEKNVENERLWVRGLYVSRSTSPLLMVARKNESCNDLYY